MRKRPTVNRQNTTIEMDPSLRVPTAGKGLLELASDNWLQVKRESDDYIVSLPKYFRAKDFSFVGSGPTRREKFRAIDWPHENETFTVKSLPDSRSRFGTVHYNMGAALVFDYRTSTLTVNPGNIVVKAGFDPNNKLANGEYLISLPDSPHAAGQGYLGLTNYALTWFFIKDNDALNRYLHAGRVSEGCLTAGLNGGDTDIRKWTEIAAMLSIQRVTTDQKFVGTLTVQGFSRANMNA